MKIHTRFDQLDGSALSEAVRSDGYNLIRVRMLEQRAQYVKALVEAKSWEETRYLQGQIASVDRSLEVPEILRTEIAAKRNRSAKNG